MDTERGSTRASAREQHGPAQRRPPSPRSAMASAKASGPASKMFLVPPFRHSSCTRFPASSRSLASSAPGRRRSRTCGPNPSSTPNMSRALSRDKFGQTPCFSGPGLIIWPASLPRWTCLDRRASSQSNIRGFAGRAAAASDRRGSPPRALYVAGVASQFVATAGGVTFGLKSLPAGVPREQRPRE